MFNAQDAFHLACERGQFQITEMLLKKSAECNIDLNAKDNHGLTSFIWACKNGHLKIAEMLVKKSTEYNIDVNAKDGYGKTGFHNALKIIKKNVVNIQNNPKIYI